jgi:hypothetical protein
VRPRLLPLLAVVALGLAACGDDGNGGSEEDKLQTAELERRLGEALSTETIPGRDSPTSAVEVRSVECPGEVDAKAGTKFECELQASGELTGKVEVTLQDARGQKLEYDAKLQGPGRTVQKSGSL